MGLQKGPARFGSLAPHRLADQASIWWISSRVGPGELAGLRIRFPRGGGDWAAHACANSSSDRAGPAKTCEQKAEQNRWSQCRRAPITRCFQSAVAGGALRQGSAPAFGGSAMKTQVEFRSNKFPSYEGEEEQINPGLWGKRLAEYLVQKLSER